MVIAFLRTIILYAFIIIGIRLMGKRQVSQLQNSELVVTLLLSELAVLPIQEEEKSLWVGLAPMAALVACELLVSVLMLKSGRFRQLVCGSPTVVIERGQVLQKAMRRLRLTTEDLFEQLRQKGVFYLEDVAWAIVETNGMLSVIRRPEEEPVTPKELGLSPASQGLEVVVISDGELSLRSLGLCGKDQAWVRRRLQERGLGQEQVFLMTVRTDGKWRVIEKNMDTARGK